ncbi:hypothetical protein DL96DRAFT_1591404 [Flagelloscypha sp. PMI_526]|nr:hypothetical protein DL96DRAFT_1591404 [Flagelloscypha sp. PMI_526]
MAFGPDDIILIIVALLFPPGAALLISGCGLDLLINLVLLFFGWIPACLHAFWLIYQKTQRQTAMYYPSAAKSNFKQSVKPRAKDTQLTFPPDTKFPWEKR